MKKVMFLIAIMAISFQMANSQCQIALSEQRFITMLNSIKSIPVGKEKVRQAIQLVRANCLNSAQVVAMCHAFHRENPRYRIALAAYPNVVDKENFYDVYDVFTKFSVAMRLHDEVLGISMVSTNRPSTGQNYAQHSPRDYAGLRFPDYHSYHGVVSVNCRVPISDKDFDYLLGRLQFTYNDNTNLSLIKDFTSNNCLATAHIMKLCSYLEFEKLRLEYLKYASTLVFDLGNYIETQQLLSHSFYKNDLVSFISQTVNPILNSREAVHFGNHVCLVSDEEFRMIHKALKDQIFPADKMKSAKLYLGNHLFTMKQIGEIVKLFTSDYDRLTILKFAYDYAPEPNKFHVFKDLLLFSYHQDELNDFILDRQRHR